MSDSSSSGSGCFTAVLFLLAAFFGSFWAASNTALPSSAPLTEAATLVTFAPTDTFTTDELEQAASVIRRRLSGLGLDRATVEVVAGTSIAVSLPQTDNFEEVVETLLGRGLLEFVDFGDVPDIGEWTGREILTTGQGDHPFSDTAVSNPVTNTPFVTVLTGDGVKSALPIYNEQYGGQWQVSLEFTEEAGKVLGEFTGSHLGKPLAIVLDGKVLSVPIIQAELTTAAVIQGGDFTEQSTRRLAVQLGGGALPFDMQVVSVE